MERNINKGPSSAPLSSRSRRTTGGPGRVSSGWSLWPVSSISGAVSFLTSFVSVPMNNQLAAVDLDAPARVLADARDAYEGPWGFWNGVRAVFSVLAFLALIGACLLREDRRRPGGRAR